MDFITITFLLSHLTDAYVIMSVDVGSRFVKNAIIRSGHQAETVYDDFGRKLPSAVSISSKQAKIGDDAIRELAKHPEDTFLLFADWVSDNASVLPIWAQLFPTSYVAHSKAFIDSRKQEHRIEELLALLLLSSAKRTDAFAGVNEVDACVLALPVFHNYLDRHLMMTVAETAGVNVTTLVPASLAAAFGFGLLQTEEYERNPMHILLIDIGAANTQMSVFQLSHRRQEDEGAPVPSLITLSTGYRRALGAWRFQSVIMESLIEQIEAKTKFDRNPKIMARLFLNAENILKKLQFDAEIDGTIENVANGLDLDFRISREDIQRKTVDLVNTARQLSGDVLKEANLTTAQIAQVIAAGGGSRIIWLEKGICEFLERPSRKFDRRINVDEGTVIGAAYYAASYSQFFRTSKFIIKDRLSYSVKVIVPAANKNGNSSEVNLFSEGILYPRRKSLYFRNRDKDFSVKLEITENGVTVNTKTVSIKGIKNVVKSQPAGVSYHGVKMTVEVDMSQILRIEKVEYCLSTAETSGDQKGESGAKSTEKTGNVSKASDIAANASLPSHNATKSNDTGANLTTVKPKTVMRYVPLQFAVTDSFPDTKPLVKSIKKRLSEYETTERLERERERLQNDVEAWLYEWSDKIARDDVSVFVKESERKAIMSATTVNRDWFDENGGKATREELAKRMDQLRQLVRPIEERITEHRRREASLQSLEMLCNVTELFLANKTNFTQENDVTPRIKPLLRREVSGLEKLYNESKELIQRLSIAEKNRSLSDDPAVRSSEIDVKTILLSKELEQLSRKVTHFRPPPPPKPVNETKTAANETAESTIPELLAGDGGGNVSINATDSVNETKAMRDEL